MNQAQFDMFGTPTAPARARANPVRPAALDDDMAELMQKMPPRLYLGTSSWSFPGWTDIVYARSHSNSVLANQGLEAYAGLGPFRTVCIDRSFYGPLSPDDFKRYAEQVPDDFRFVVKADSAITTYAHRHDGQWQRNPTFLDLDYCLRNVIEPYAEGLREKAGVLLLQFPPVGHEVRRKPPQFADRLGAFLQQLPAGIRYAVEIRDAELMGPWFARAVRQSGALYCIGLHPRMPPLLKQRSLMAAASDGPLVVRWNLHPTQGYEQAKDRYAPFDKLVDEDRPTRNALAKLARESLASRRDVFIIANNKAEGSAPLSLFALAKGILGRA